MNHLERMITAAIELMKLEAVCHHLTDREVLSIWAQGLGVDATTACVARLGRLGSAA